MIKDENNLGKMEYIPRDYLKKLFKPQKRKGNYLLTGLATGLGMILAFTGGAYLAKAIENYKPNLKPSLERAVTAPEQSKSQESVKPQKQKTEEEIIDYAAKRFGVEPELLTAIRKAENSKKYAFGIIPNDRYRKDSGIVENDKVIPYTSEFEKQAIWCAATIKKAKERFAENEGKSFIEFLSATYAPIDAPNDPDGLNKNWVGNVKTFYDELKRKENKGLEAKVPTLPNAPKFKEVVKNDCAKYARLAAKQISGSEYNSANAWEFAERNQLVSEINGDLAGYEDKLKPGVSIVSFYYPKSKYNAPDRKVTHVALYLGKDKDGKFIFAENAGVYQRAISYQDLLKKGYSPRELIEPIQKTEEDMQDYLQKTQEDSIRIAVQKAVDNYENAGAK